MPAAPGAQSLDRWAPRKASEPGLYVGSWPASLEPSVALVSGWPCPAWLLVWGLVLCPAFPSVGQGPGVRKPLPDPDLSFGLPGVELQDGVGQQRGVLVPATS